MGIKSIALSVSALVLSTNGYAGIILQADSVWTDGVSVSYPVGNVINQSGLSANYISEVDDFDAIVNSTTASYSSGASTTLGDTSAQLDNFYFDLGDIYTIDALAIWNQAGSASLKTFDILAATDSTFGVTTHLGSFSIADGPGFAPGYIFNFADTSSQYFMIDVTSNYGWTGTTRINEAAFSINTVPVPAAAWLFGSGLLGLISVARRKNI